MIATATNLILPAADALPLPAPAGLVRVLLLATFLLHLLAMNALLGGLLIAAVEAFRGRGGALAPAIAKTSPTLVAATVTLGVAPLLFLQTLMGPFFFTSSILMGWAWFSIVVVLILAYYGTYLQAFRWAKQRRVHRGVLVATGLGFLWISFVFSNNTSLMAAPAAWPALYFADARGLHLNLGDATLLPRWIHAVLGAVAVAGLALAWWGRRRPDAAMERTGLKTFTLVTLVNLAVGVWYLAALPRPALRLFMGGSAGATAVFGAGFLLGLAALAFGWRAWRRGPGAGLGAVTATTLAVMALMVVQRDLARAAALGELYLPADLAAEPQWLNMGIFAVLLAGGIGLVVWMVGRLRTGRVQTEG
jgi:hypothetical protein